MKLRPKIDPHNDKTKKGHVARFLKAGGPQQSRPELVCRLLQRLAEDVSDWGMRTSPPSRTASATAFGELLGSRRRRRGSAQLYDLLPGPSGRDRLRAGPAAWVFGNEARGLDPVLAAAADRTRVVRRASTSPPRHRCA